MPDMRRRLQVPKLPIQTEKGVLGQLFGILRPAGQPQRQTVDASLVATYEPDKGAAVSVVIAIGPARILVEHDFDARLLRAIVRALGEQP